MGSTLAGPSTHDLVPRRCVAPRLQRGRRFRGTGAHVVLPRQSNTAAPMADALRQRPRSRRGTLSGDPRSGREELEARPPHGSSRGVALSRRREPRSVALATRRSAQARNVPRTSSVSDGGRPGRSDHGARRTGAIAGAPTLRAHTAVPTRSSSERCRRLHGLRCRDGKDPSEARAASHRYRGRRIIITFESRVKAAVQDISPRADVDDIITSVRRRRVVKRTVIGTLAVVVATAGLATWSERDSHTRVVVSTEPRPTSTNYRRVAFGYVIDVTVSSDSPLAQRVRTRLDIAQQEALAAGHSTVPARTPEVAGAYCSRASGYEPFQSRPQR